MKSYRPSPRHIPELNGLRVLLHRDDTTPLVTLNLLYCVGSRNERSDRTGFAHLLSSSLVD